MYRLTIDGEERLCLNGREAFDILAETAQRRIHDLSVTRLFRDGNGIYAIVPGAGGAVDKVSVYSPSFGRFDRLVATSADWGRVAREFCKFLGGCGMEVTVKGTRGGPREGAGRKKGGRNGAKGGVVHVAFPFDLETLRRLEILCGEKSRSAKARYLASLIDGLYRARKT